MEIPSLEVHSERQIGRKIQILKNRVDYCLQRYAESDKNVDTKSGRPRVTSVAEDRHLILSSKGNRRNSKRPTTEFNSTDQHPLSIKIVKTKPLSYV